MPPSGTTWVSYLDCTLLGTLKIFWVPIAFAGTHCYTGLCRVETFDPETKGPRECRQHSGGTGTS